MTRLEGGGAPTWACLALLFAGLLAWSGSLAVAERSTVARAVMATLPKHAQSDVTDAPQHLWCECGAVAALPKGW
ncbi:MAG: hypothetical protein RLO52_10715 [Sandaracinaceae bacterium]|nr:MAG: hypothetical protein EVA89_38045 [Sandaracinaceae bacterium]